MLRPSHSSDEEKRRNKTEAEGFLERISRAENDIQTLGEKEGGQMVKRFVWKATVSPCLCCVSVWPKYGKLLTLSPFLHTDTHTLSAQKWKKKGYIFSWIHAVSRQHSNNVWVKQNLFQLSGYRCHLKWDRWGAAPRWNKTQHQPLGSNLKPSEIC